MNRDELARLAKLLRIIEAAECNAQMFMRGTIELVDSDGDSFATIEFNGTGEHTLKVSR